MIVAELLTRLGWTVDTAGLQRYANAMKQASVEMSKIALSSFKGFFDNIISKSLHTFGEFEQHLNNLEAVSGATAGELEHLKKQALDLGRATQFDPIEIVAGQEELARTGYKTNQVMQMMPGIVKLSSISLTSLATSAEFTSNILHQFGLEAKDASMITDVLATATTNGAHMADLSYTFKYAGSAAKSAGQDFKSMAEMATLLSNNGIKGSQAGTTLRTAFINLSAPTKGMTKVIEKYKLSIKDAHGNMRPLAKMLGELQTKMKGMGNVQKNADLGKLFGKNAVSGILAIINAGDDAKKRISKAFENIEGAGDRMSEKMNRGLLFSFKKMQSSGLTLFKVLGEQLAPSFEKLANAVEYVLNKISEADPWIHKLIAGFLLASSAILTFLTAALGIQALKIVVAHLTLDFLKLDAAMFLIPATILLAVAAVALFINDLYVFANGGDSLIGRFLKPFPKIKQMLMAIIDKVVWFYNIAIAAFQNVSDAINQAFGSSTGYVEKFLYLILGIGGAITAVVGLFLIGLTSVAVSFGYLISLIPSLTIALYTLLSFFTPLPILIIKGLWSILSAFLSFAAVVAVGIYNAFAGLVKSIPIIFSSLLTAIPAIFNGLASAAQTIASAIGNIFLNLVNNIISYFSNAFTSRIPSFISSLTGGINVPITVSAKSAGGGGINIGNINNSTSVNLSGSGASPAGIANASHNGSKNGIGKAIAQAASNSPKGLR